MQADQIERAAQRFPYSPRSGLIRAIIDYTRPIDVNNNEDSDEDEDD